MAMARVDVSERAGTATGAPDGAAMAAVVAAGVGAFAMGLFVILHEAGIFSAPSLYAPAGALSGRSTFAVVVWLGGWGLLHARWRGRSVGTGRLFAITLGLVALGIIGTYPPVWNLF
jgi:hypothetical protein